jgi:hypothetical protein
MNGASKRNKTIGVFIKESMFHKNKIYVVIFLSRDSNTWAATAWTSTNVKRSLAHALTGTTMADLLIMTQQISGDNSHRKI